MADWKFGLVLYSNNISAITYWLLSDAECKGIWPKLFGMLGSAPFLRRVKQTSIWSQITARYKAVHPNYLNFTPASLLLIESRLKLKAWAISLKSPDRHALCSIFIHKFDNFIITLTKSFPHTLNESFLRWFTSSKTRKNKFLNKNVERPWVWC